MLNFKYTCDEENVNGNIFISLDPSYTEMPYNLPSNFPIKNLLSGEKRWRGILPIT